MVDKKPEDKAPVVPEVIAPPKPDEVVAAKGEVLLRVAGPLGTTGFEVPLPPGEPDEDGNVPEREFLSVGTAPKPFPAKVAAAILESAALHGVHVVEVDA